MNKKDYILNEDEIKKFNVFVLVHNNCPKVKDNDVTVNCCVVFYPYNSEKIIPIAYCLSCEKKLELSSDARYGIGT